MNNQRMISEQYNNYKTEEEKNICLKEKNKEREKVRTNEWTRDSKKEKKKQRIKQTN